MAGAFFVSVLVRGEAFRPRQHIVIEEDHEIASGGFDRAISRSAHAEFGTFEDAKARGILSGPRGSGRVAHASGRA